LAEQRSLGDVCEAGGVFLHELGNALNVMLFELALLERKASEEVRVSLAALRDQGRGVAQQMQELRRYEDGQRPKLYAVDVNAVVQAAAAEEPAAPLTLALAAGLPPVQATVGDLLRVVRFLVALAARGPGRERPLGVQTEHAGDRVLVRVRWAGRPGAEPLDEEGRFAWAICQRVLRRLRGALRVESQADGGAFCVELAVVPG
jgi:hypothetical protein